MPFSVSNIVEDIFSKGWASLRSDDEVFVTRCLEGDQPAFVFLVTKYKEAVHAYAYRKVGDYQQAEDISQEVFIKAYKKLAQLKWPHKFRSWLYTIVSNECKLWLRNHSREQEVSWDDVPSENLDELAVRSHSDEDIRLTVKSAMETLPADNQLALSLYYMSDLSVKEIASFMGVSPNTVKGKLHRARRQLGERLEDMLGKQLRKEKLKAGFIFRIVDAIRDMPIPSLPKPRPIKWAPIPISIGIALLIGVIGYGVSSGRDVPQDMPVLKPVETRHAVSFFDLDEQEVLGIKAVGNELVALNSGDDTTPKDGRSSDTGIVVRRAWDSMGGALMGMAISPDGRYLSFCNWKNGNLAVRDLTTGRNRDITDDATWYGAQSHAIDSAWSPDGVQIACWWSGGNHSGLRIVGLDGSQPRDLYNTSGSSRARIRGCYDWSKDGKYILARLVRKTDENKWLWEIRLVSVADGSMRILKTAEGLAAGDPAMKFSPDGRYVVYDREVEEHERLRDIFLLATDGSGEEVRLTEHPADDYNPVWAPDGKAIVFVSNRDPGGGKGLWLVQVADGKPVGEPQLVKGEVGDIVPLGFTRKGSLFYTTTTRWSHIYVASLDMETGKLLSSPELLRSQGLNHSPAWSPDGKSLAYVSERTSPGSFHRRPVLVIRFVETGEERELLSKPADPAHEIGGQLRWSPDGCSILYGGQQWDPLHLIDVQTGHITQIPRTDSQVFGPAWSPDGKTIYYTGVDVGNVVENWPSRIVALDLETRQDRELCQGGCLRGIVAVSPDGRQLAFLDKVFLGGTSGKVTLKVVPAAGGEPRILLDRKDLNLRDTHNLDGPCAWTPDGRYVLFTISKWYDHVLTDSELWQIPAEGGKPKKLLEIESPYRPGGIRCPLSFHPDGRRIAFHKGRARLEGEMDLWVMENFLPEFTADK